MLSKTTSGLAFVILLLEVNLAHCQMDDSVETRNKPVITLIGYLDLFYGYDFNQPQTESRLPYLYHYNRHNEVNLNHGYLSVNLDHAKYRANFGLHTGTYVIDNYTNEPDLLKLIYDANIGLALNNRNSLWLDIGIFGNSHIGAESTDSWTNWTASRTVLSENVPYYQAGLNLNWTQQDWYVALLILNGWQKIKRIQGNSIPSFGTQVTYSGFELLSLNWSTFIGTDTPDSTRQMRYFSHFNTVINISENWGVTLGWDTGFEQKFKGSVEYHNWNGILTMLRYQFNSKFSATARYEFYSDPESVIVSTPSANGYRTSGVSANVDYNVLNAILCRLEARYFFSPDEIYPKEGSFITDNFFVLATISTQIDWVVKE